MDAIEPATLDQLRLKEIESVTFYKRDEITTDLICCEVEIGGKVWFFHEEADGWDLLLQHLEKLPGFRLEWRRAVVHLPFESCETVAYSRNERRPLSTPG